MSRSSRDVEGYDYVRKCAVRMPPADWRDMYPPTIYRRCVEQGETFYHRIGGTLAAEAYANIPEGK